MSKKNVKQKESIAEEVTSIAMSIDQLANKLFKGGEYGLVDMGICDELGVIVKQNPVKIGRQILLEVNIHR